MVRLPDRERSYWKSIGTKTSYSALKHDLFVDVAIIGGGIAGLTSAYLLKKAGLSVAVLEKNTVASGTTGGTTGKVTSQHGIIYAELQKRHGTKTARAYANANQAAIEQIEQIIKKEKIDCDWHRADNYVYTTDERKISEFMSEAAAAKKLGLPASFETTSELPFDIAGAVRFRNQAYFNAHKYVRGLAKAVHGHGSFVFENSNVTKIKDGKLASVGANNATVAAKNIIVASKVPAWPLWARFSSALWEYPHTSYITAGTFKGNISGMYISPDSGHYSILPVKEGNKQLLLVGGENHIPGMGRPKKRHLKLARYAKQQFGVNPAYRWKAMDYIAYDKAPLVGRVYPWSKRLYTVTGFKKWGLTTSMVAGNLLRDIILNKPNELAIMFDSTRLKPIISIPRIGIKWFEKLPNAAKAFGVVLLLIGIGGFIPGLTSEGEHGMPLLIGFLVGGVHNVIHLSSALVALISSKKASWAKAYFQVFGIIYGLVTLIGFLTGDTILGQFHVNMADNFLHLFISASSLWLGFMGGKS